MRSEVIFKKAAVSYVIKVRTAVFVSMLHQWQCYCRKNCPF